MPITLFNLCSMYFYCSHRSELQPNFKLNVFGFELLFLEQIQSVSFVKKIEVFRPNEFVKSIAVI